MTNIERMGALLTTLLGVEPKVSHPAAGWHVTYDYNGTNVSVSEELLDDQKVTSLRHVAEALATHLVRQLESDYGMSPPSGWGEAYHRRDLWLRELDAYACPMPKAWST